MTVDIEKAADKFLTWALPEDFSPDGGITYVRPTFPGYPAPRGTNLLNDRQAREMLEHILVQQEGPVPMRINCPTCGLLHVDEGEWVERPHHTHSCQGCGMTWRPAVINTVGVQFLPGAKNEEK